MSIPVNTTSFVDTPSTQAFQNWESPSPTPFVHVQTAANLIYPALFAVKIKDIIGTPEASGYLEFRLKVMKFYYGTTSPVDWLSANSSLFNSLITGVQISTPITNTGLIDNITVFLPNLALVNIGIHECRITYTIEGKTPANIWNEISISFILIVYNLTNICINRFYKIFS